MDLKQLANDFWDCYLVFLEKFKDTRSVKHMTYKEAYSAGIIDGLKIAHHLHLNSPKFRLDVEGLINANKSDLRFHVLPDILIGPSPKKYEGIL